MIVDPPDGMVGVEAVKDVLAKHPNDDVHLVLIHGIRASDRTTWDGFRKALCAHLGGQCVGGAPTEPITERLDLGYRPGEAEFLGRPIWTSDAAWAGSRPFVDHYLFQLKSASGGPPRRLFVDEINWWPLVLAFKCQFIVGDDTDLAGADDSNIKNCTEAGAAQTSDNLHYG